MFALKAVRGEEIESLHITNAEFVTLDFKSFVGRKQVEAIFGTKKEVLRRRSALAIKNAFPMESISRVVNVSGAESWVSPNCQFSVLIHPFLF